MSKKKTDKDADFKINDIDKYNLDGEIILTDRMTRYFCEQLADAIKKRDRTKGLIELEEAKLAKKIRTRPEKYGLDKPTNEPVKEEVIIRLHKTSLPEDMLKADHRVNLLKGIVNQCNGRGKGVSDLVFLHNSGYFASSKKKKNRDREKRTKT